MTLRRVALRVALLPFMAACAARTPPATRVEPPGTLPPVGFSIQAGAFANPENALRLSESLRQRGLEAFYFRSDDGLHKVRFGSFGTRDLARQRADALRRERVIDRYYIVRPEPRRSPGDDPRLRDRVVRSAMSFLGSPYRWGGPSAETGFDCSGLTMTAYRLNGLALPRTAAEQYEAGKPLPRARLKEADLVFFATSTRRVPSHVGLYVGQGRFIHAPGQGKVVRTDELSSGYFERRYLGARSYVN